MSRNFIKDLVKLARPYQYSKNLFVFIPAFFAFQLTQWEVIKQASLAFLSFSLIASAVYIFNDFIDKKEDAQHPEKCLRPLASGRITTTQAFFSLAAFIAIGLFIASYLHTSVLMLLSLYMMLNMAYSIKLKHIAIIDINIIAVGFVIRLLVGAKATQIELSHWIIIMTFLLALFLSLAKRRDDVLIYLKTEQKMRKVIDGYNLRFLDSAMVVTATIVIMAYVLWSISPEATARLYNENLYLSAIFVILGILRYMQIAFVEEKSGNPSKVLLKDRFIQLTLLGWLSTFVWILYL